MTKLLSRKEVYSRLGISERTLRRKIQELDIQCVNEKLPNGVVSSKITYEDFLKIAETCRDSNINTSETSAEINADTKDLALIYNLKTDLVKKQIELQHAENIIREKETLIHHLSDEKAKLEEKNALLFDQFMQSNDKYIDALRQINDLQSKLIKEAEHENNEGFFKRILRRR